MISLPIVDHPTKVKKPVGYTVRVENGIEDEKDFFGKIPEYSLSSFLNGTLPLPLHTAFLGLNLDGSPLFFDLMDPRPGAILVVSDSGAGKLQLAKTIVYSLIFTNPSYEVQFSLISARTNHWRFEYGRYQSYFCHFTNNYDYPARKAIMDEADRVESRQHGRNEGECRVLILDGFDTLPYMDFDIRLNFEWLLQEGPYYQIWPIVLMDSRTAREQKKWVNQFKTRIVGKMKNHHLASEITEMTALDTRTLVSGREFVVSISGREHHFFIPNSI